VVTNLPSQHLLLQQQVHRLATSIGLLCSVRHPDPGSGAFLQCCGSGMFPPGYELFSIMNPGSKFFPYRIPDPHQRISQISIKEFKYFYPKKLFLSSWEYDPGCSSRIRILMCYPSPISEPESHICNTTFLTHGSGIRDG
jgi:hypothetical protein